METVIYNNSATIYEGLLVVVSSSFCLFNVNYFNASDDIGFRQATNILYKLSSQVVSQLRQKVRPFSLSLDAEYAAL
jgi:hypothetical protein